MQLWEYCEVVVGIDAAVSFYAPTGRRTVPVPADVSAPGEGRRASGERFVGQLGLDGWELVGVVERIASASAHGISYFFKRPLP